jgi:cystathionine beta-lyase
MDFGLAEPITRDLAEAARNNLTGYVPLPLRKELRVATAEYQARKHGWEIDPKQVFALPDVLAGLIDVMSHWLRPGSKVIAITPCYMPFLLLPEVHHREIIEVPMVEDASGWRLDLDDLDAAFRAGGELLIFCNPQNPIGKVYTRAELEGICEVVARHGGTVFSDEIHAPLIYDGLQHIPYASLNETAARHTVTSFSASKAFNTAGLKCAQMVLTNPDQQAWAAARDLEHEPSALGTIANIAAYREGDPWLADVLAYLDGTRHAIADWTAELLPEARICVPDATFLAWLDLSAYELGDHLGIWFRSHASVAFQDGIECGQGGRGHVRLNFGTPRPIVRTILERMADAIATRGA